MRQKLVRQRCEFSSQRVDSASPPHPLWARGRRQIVGACEGSPPIHQHGATVVVIVQQTHAADIASCLRLDVGVINRLGNDVNSAKTKPGLRLVNGANLGRVERVVRFSFTACLRSAPRLS